MYSYFPTQSDVLRECRRGGRLRLRFSSLSMVGMFGAQRSAAELVHHSNEVLNSQFPHLARAASRSHGFWMIHHRLLLLAQSALPSSTKRLRNCSVSPCPRLTTNRFSRSLDLSDQSIGEMMRTIVLALCALALCESAAQAAVASYYGPGFAGRRTASGERFNPSAMTAAHRTLRFGTRVKVTNSRNGRWWFGSMTVGRT